MLKQPTQDFPYIAVFKIASGEEFIGEIIDETMMAYKVKKPLCMVPTEKGFQFAPFMLMADTESYVQVPKPVIIASPAKNLKASYEQATSPIALIKK